MTVPFSVAVRLAKLLGMLGSSHDGERASAAKMAHKALTEAGLTWPIVLGLEGVYLPDAEKIEACASWLDQLDDWDRRFIVSLHGQVQQGRSLSDKQVAVLERILAKVKLLRGEG